LIEQNELDQQLPQHGSECRKVIENAKSIMLSNQIELYWERNDTMVLFSCYLLSILLIAVIILL